MLVVGKGRPLSHERDHARADAPPTRNTCPTCSADVYPVSAQVLTQLQSAVDGEFIPGAVTITRAEFCTACRVLHYDVRILDGEQVTLAWDVPG